jgi:SRSO17 transposase
LIILRKEILQIGICYLEDRRLEKVKEYLVNFTDSLATAPLIQDLIDQTGSRKKKTSGGASKRR